MNRITPCVFLAAVAAAPSFLMAGRVTIARVDSRVSRLLKRVDSGRIERDIRRLVAFGTRHTLSATNDPARGIGAARSWVRREMEQIAATSGGRLRVDTDTFTVPAGGRFPRAAEVTNLVATLAGTDPNRVLVVSGHLDSRASDVLDGTSDAPGADDDASGVAAVLELVRAMAPQKFRATLVFLAVSAEEQGLQGSRHWAQAARAADRNIEAMLNNDIIGSSRGANGVRDDRHVRLFSEGVPAAEAAAPGALRVPDGAENDSPSRQLARAVADAQRRYLPRFRVALRYRRDRVFRGGDHIPFNEAGYAAVRFTEMNEDWRHQHQDVYVREGMQFGDLLPFVDPEYAANVTRVNLAALADLAWAPPPPSHVRLRVEIAPPRASEVVRLLWDRAQDPDRLGFEALWRATTAPDWQGARFVGNEGEATLPLSVDDFIFAVRAVSREGNRSLPVVALPARS